MKKILVIGCLILSAGAVHAMDTLCTDWGKAQLCVPVTTGVDAAFGYDFRGHKSQGLGETSFAYWNIGSDSRIALKAGGITSDNGKGAPFLGIDYELKSVGNPIPGIASIYPGVYGGHDFHTNEWFYGVKASIPLLEGN